VAPGAGGGLRGEKVGPLGFRRGVGCGGGWGCGWGVRKVGADGGPEGGGIYWRGVIAFRRAPAVRRDDDGDSAQVLVATTAGEYYTFGGAPDVNRCGGESRGAGASWYLTRA
jgi:hypothetical protein